MGPALRARLRSGETGPKEGAEALPMAVADMWRNLPAPGKPGTMAIGS